MLLGQIKEINKKIWVSFLPAIVQLPEKVHYFSGLAAPLFCLFSLSATFILVILPINSSSQ